MKQKLKILVCGEASFLSSGFAVYQKQLLEKLSSNPNFYVAELACYGGVNDTKDSSVKWRYYANAVKKTDPRYDAYMSSPLNQFGRWRFDSVVLDFKPDVVIDIRDYWMNSYQRYSPLRSFFHWILMPTVDSYPQQEEWIETFSKADAVFTYSDWGRDVLLSQASGSINYIDTCSPGYDETFGVRRDARKNMNLPDDIFIIGSVMRNQKRKLLAEIIRDTRKLIDKVSALQPEYTSKIYLYLHTAFPDHTCWNIPKLLKEFRMCNRTLFTYLCRNCKHVEARLYQGHLLNCPKCKNHSLVHPTVSESVSRDQLCNIYNTFDLYVQYSICEGFGMPQVEAASCGVPVVSVNYSAMEDIVSKLNAIRINPIYYFRELETFADRSYPNSDQFIDSVIRYINKPQFTKNIKKIATQHRAFLFYNWESTLQKWENYLTKLYNSDYRANYKHTKTIIPTIDKNQLSRFQCNLDKINYMIAHIKSTIDISDYMAMDFLERLNNKFILDNGTYKNYSEDELIGLVNDLIENHNYMSAFMNQNIDLSHNDYIMYANMKDPNIK